jgi:hypothetical protein
VRRLRDVGGQISKRYERQPGYGRGPRNDVQEAARGKRYKRRRRLRDLKYLSTEHRAIDLDRVLQERGREQLGDAVGELRRSTERDSSGAEKFGRDHWHRVDRRSVRTARSPERAHRRDGNAVLGRLSAM